MSEFCFSRKVTTRKPHKCGFCGRSIPKGYTVTHNSGRYDNDWFSYYICDFCELYINKIDPDLSDGFNEDFLFEDLSEMGFYSVDITDMVSYSDIEDTVYSVTWNEFFEIILKSKKT